MQTSEAPSTTQDPRIYQVRRLLIDVSCLPCYKMEETGCRKIFGCIQNSDGSVISIFPPTSLVARDRNKNAGRGQSASTPEESPCLQCYSYDRSGRCRKIRGCVSSTASTPIPSLSPAVEEISSLTPEDSGREDSVPSEDTTESEDSVPPEDTTEGSHAASGKTGHTGSSDSQWEPTGVPVTPSADTSLVPSVESSTENYSVPPWFSNVPLIRTFAPPSTEPRVDEADQPTSSL